MDFLNLDEFTMGNIFQDNGYTTAHFGKWHNGKTDGYFPWHRGFDLSYLVYLYTFYNNPVLLNGQEVNAYGWVEEWLADRVIDFMTQAVRSEEGKPFMALWTPMTVHEGRVNVWENYEDFVAPNEYIEKYMAYEELSNDVAKVFGALEFWDYCLGKVLTALDRLGVAGDTTVMFLGDNGPLLFGTDHSMDPERSYRVPSRMYGEKGNIEDNGVRSFLFVRQPGVIQPKIVYDLVDVTDIVPTMMQLGNISTQPYNEFDGVSFSSLLFNDNWWHSNRTVFIHEAIKNTLGEDQVLELDYHRDPHKYQYILSYWNGGLYNLGMDPYSTVRQGSLKWHRGKVFEIIDSFNKESDYFQVQDSKVQDYMGEIAAQWWEDMLHAPGSFQKPVFIIGYRGFYRSIVLPYAPVERSPFDIRVTAQSVSGFWQHGNFLNVRVRVDTPGIYRVIIFYELAEPFRSGLVRVTVGKFSDIMERTAPFAESRIEDVVLGPYELGTMYLPTSTEDDKTELRLETFDLSNNVLGAFFKYLSEIHLERIDL
eukprot:TRINITY_DN1936_c0_g2_i4.p1 TRINITY_DN1936_c0_g2~~TRINITY_DN1936_c0_g2_i4.p1  ORF type:complete len:535 (-),score=89.36 TRINITY_DN1936_c0_g2_i4:1232-2836(-)